MEISLGWLIVGFMGQIFFSSRFILQWIYSEISKKSIIPLGFWFFSILGGVTLLIYAIHRKDPVFIMGQATGILIYGRNLYFINKQNKIDLRFKSIVFKIKAFFKDLWLLITKRKKKILIPTFH